MSKPFADGSASTSAVERQTNTTRDTRARDALSTASSVVGVVHLTSGERVRIEGQDLEAVGALIGAFADFRVEWHRIGHSGSIDRQLTREARQRAPDLLVLVAASDVELRLKAARASYGSLPILAIGATRDSEPVALEAGADAFCVLPADQVMLEGRARALMRRLRDGAFSARSDSAIELETSSRTLRFAGAVIQLSASEYALIERLYAQRDSWVPPAELWKAVARDKPGYDSSLLRMHAMNVRKKLGAHRWILQSERGKGMMLTTIDVYKAMSHDES